MRSSYAARTSSAPSDLLTRFISILCVVTLCCGLMPSAAFAADDSSLSLIPEGEQGVASIASSAEGGDNDGFSHYASDAASSADGSDAAIPSEDASNNDDLDRARSIETSGSELDGETSDGDVATIPVADLNIINRLEPLQVVAKSESTRSYFLAQTLESTRTVPMVSAKLPIDTGIVDRPDGSAGDGFANGTEDGSVNATGSGDDPEEPYPATGRIIAAESTVVGSFEYFGMTFAVEADGASVALVAADYSKLPQEFIGKQVIVIPETVTLDGIDYYSVTRIADNAFAGFTKEIANPEHVGCEALFTDEELLAEAGIDAASVASFLDAEDEMIDIDGDGKLDTIANPLVGCTGILALGVPASVIAIEDDAFAGFETLQYIVISEDNIDNASYDGAVYNADLTELLFVPEGRVGMIRVAASVTAADPEVVSRCPLVDALAIDAKESSYAMPRAASLVQKVLRFVFRANMPLSVASLSDDGSSVFAVDNRAVLFANSYSLNIHSTVAWECSSNVYKNSALHSSGSWESTGEVTYIRSGYKILVNGTWDQYDNYLSVWQDNGLTYDLFSFKSTELGRWVDNSFRRESPTGSKFRPMTYTESLDPWLNSGYTAYKVVFAPGEGSGAQSDMTGVTINSTITLPSNEDCGMSKPGYRISGWSNGIASFAPGKAISVLELAEKTGRAKNLREDAIELTAQWEIDQITIEWNSKGGSAVDSTTTSYMEGSTVTLPTDPTRAGYIFAGWYDIEADMGGNPVTADTAFPTSNTIYWARWTKIGNLPVMLKGVNEGVPDKTVWYWPEKGYLAANDDKNAVVVAKNSEIVDTTALKIFGYRFEGYFDKTQTGSSAKQMIDSSGRLLVDMNDAPLEAAAEWYAHWGRVEDSVILKVGGGEFPGGATEVTLTFDCDTKDTLLNEIAAREPSRLGYEFAGWDPALRTPTWNATTSSWEGPLAYTAIWKLDVYSIAYDLNEKDEDGGVGNYKGVLSATDDQKKYSYDETGSVPVIALGTATRPGYVFLHWYEGEDESIAASIDPKERTGNVYLKAAWAPVLSAVLPVASSKTVEFALDTVSGTVDGSRTIEMTTVTPHDTYLSVASSVDDNDIETLKSNVLFKKDGATDADIDAVVDSLGFSFMTIASESHLTSASPDSFSLLANGGCVTGSSRLRLQGSEKHADANSSSTVETVVKGALKLAMFKDGSFADVLVPIDRIGVSTGFEGSIHLADIVWTVSLL